MTHYQELELEGDLRYLPLHELVGRIEQLRASAAAGKNASLS